MGDKFELITCLSGNSSALLYRTAKSDICFYLRNVNVIRFGIRPIDRVTKLKRLRVNSLGSPELSDSARRSMVDVVFFGIHPKLGSDKDRRNGFTDLPLIYTMSRHRGRIRTGSLWVMSHVVPSAFAAKNWLTGRGSNPRRPD